MRKAAVKILITLSIMVLCLAGCKMQPNEKDSNNENCAFISIKGDFDTENLPERTASIIKPGKIDYTVTAYKVEDKNGTQLTGDDIKTVTETEPLADLDLTYKLNLDTGGWIFDVKGYEHVDGSSESSRTNVILHGSTTTPVKCNGKRYYETVYVYFTTEETGSVNLEIDASKVTINKLKISGTNIGLDDVYTKDSSTGKIKINKTGLASGKYKAKMDFYYNTVLLYTTEEIINITDNLVVNNWIYSGGNEYLVKKSSSDSADEVYTANFVLTPELIIKGKNTECWVQGTGVTNPIADKAAKTPSDSNSGSAIAPYATLQAAFDRTMALNTEFKEAGKQQRNFTIYINGTVNSAAIPSGAQTPGEAEITAPSGSSFNLLISKEQKGSSGKINGNISIGTNVPVTISSVTMDGLKAESKLTLNSCTLSGKSDFEITNVSDESVITNTKIGDENSSGTRTAKKITFNNSNVKILNNKDCPIYTTDFVANNSFLNLSCNSSSSSDRITVQADTFKIANSSGTADNELLISGVTIHTNSSSKDFSLEGCNYLKLKSSVLSGTNFNTSNLQNTTLENCQITSTDKSTINESQLVLNNTSVTGSLSIKGKTTGTEKAGKVTFTGKSSKVSGISTEVLNTTVEMKNESSITSTNSITFTNTNLSLDTASAINSTQANLTIKDCTTTLSNAAINTKTIKTGDATVQSSSTKTDTISVSSSTLTTTEGLTFNSSSVNISASTIYGQLFVLNDNLTLHNSTLFGDIGNAANSDSGIVADGIDTASKVILSGTSVLKSYSTYTGNVYLEDTAILYVKGLPSKEDSATTIAALSALYPTKDEVVLVMLDANNNETSFDNTFTVSDTTIDERFKLASAGYYLDYVVPEGGSIRKGVIKESRIGIHLPETGGYTIGIATNDKVQLNSSGYIVIDVDDLATAPIKAVIKDKNNNVITPNITYQLYRESAKIGDAVTSATSSNGITISNSRITQEMQYTNKLTYMLQITFVDSKTNLTYSDIFFVNIVNQ